MLVKPQFELPDHLVRAGKVDDPVLRTRALDTFRAKAESLGFRLLAFADSPVTGGEGTVEILTHLRFEGRPTHLPQPGERKPARPKPGRRRELPARLTWFAVASPGLETVVGDEVGRLPGADFRPSPSPLAGRPRRPPPPRQ